MTTDYSLKLLYSGSGGNAALLTTKDATVLIDAGATAKALCAALAEVGCKPEQIDAVFLTHEHRDHVGALDVFLRQYPTPVHTTTASATKMKATAGDALIACLVEHPPLFSVTVGNLVLTSFPTMHDSAGSVGYRITVNTSSPHLLGYATDLGVVTGEVERSLSGCEAVVIECNHDEEMLRTGPYPFYLKRRIASPYGHLSNPDCAALCARLATCGTRRFLLAHLSETNNLPDLALGEVRASLAGTGATAKAASPDTVTEL